MALYPGCDRTLIDASVAAGARGLVFDAMGSGNANPNILAAVQDCTSNGIAVVVTSRVQNGVVEPIYGGEGGGRGSAGRRGDHLAMAARPAGANHVSCPARRRRRSATDGASLRRRHRARCGWSTAVDRRAHCTGVNLPDSWTHRRGAILRRNAAESVFEDLCSAIESGELPIGVKLPSEAALAERYGVSRSVIREALRSCQTLGLTSTKTGLGTIVVSSHASVPHYGRSRPGTLSRPGPTLKCPLPAGLRGDEPRPNWRTSAASSTRWTPRPIRRGGSRWTPSSTSASPRPPETKCSLSVVAAHPRCPYPSNRACSTSASPSVGWRRTRDTERSST